MILMAKALLKDQKPILFFKSNNNVKFHNIKSNYLGEMLQIFVFVKFPQEKLIRWHNIVKFLSVRELSILVEYNFLSHFEIF